MQIICLLPLTVASNAIYFDTFPVHLYLMKITKILVVVRLAAAA